VEAVVAVAVEAGLKEAQEGVVQIYFL